MTFKRTDSSYRIVFLFYHLGYTAATRSRLHAGQKYIICPKFSPPPGESSLTETDELLSALADTDY